MAFTRYQAYYNKILEQVKEIRIQNCYNNNSVAFCHWYLSNYMKLNEQQIAESIIDGSDDMGIDAIYLDEENELLCIFQFKFPSSSKNITSEISQGDILKTWNGFDTLISNDKDYNGTNEKYSDFKKELENSIITKYKLYFVSYNKGIKNNKSIITNNANKFKSDYGSDIEIVENNIKDISDIYEKLNRLNNIKINLKYKQLQAAYDGSNRNINSYIGLASGVDLVEAIKNNITTIFDENIRLFEFDTSVNKGIKRTAVSEKSDMFYFYNNGIVFICDKVNNSIASSSVTLEGASVVNGCQTLNVLYNVMMQGKLKPDVHLLIRIIEIKGYDERMEITEYLNSQNPIKASYFIANHPIVRELQAKLSEKGYFLERQANEYKYKQQHIEKYEGNKVLKLDEVIQCFVGYYNNAEAVVAKRSKRELFEKKKIEEILAQITEDMVIESETVYKEICHVLTIYRKNRRNKSNEEFANFMGITNSELNHDSELYRFINTGDILLLNTFSNLKTRYKDLSIKINDEDLIKDSILIAKDILKTKDDSPSVLTKNNKVFTDIQEYIAKLNQKYVSD